MKYERFDKSEGGSRAGVIVWACALIALVCYGAVTCVTGH